MNKERVNIQYSIDLGELPTETQRLIHRASSLNKEDLTECFKDLCSVEGSEVLSLGTLTSIDIARKKLAAIDYALSDVSDIINGFLHFQVQQNLQGKFENQPAVRKEMPTPPAVRPPMPTPPAVRPPEDTSGEA
jgi:hypothetical protein